MFQMLNKILSCVIYVKQYLFIKETTGSGCMLRHLRSCPSKENDLDSSHQQTNIKQYCKSTINEKNGTKKYKRCRYSSLY